MMSRTSRKHRKRKVRTIPNSIVPIDRDDNPLVSSLKENVRKRQMGSIRRDIPEEIYTDEAKEFYEHAVWTANDAFLDKPDWCYERYGIKFSKDGDIGGMMNAPKPLWERIIWFRVNPWRWAHQVIGNHILSRTASAGKPFRSFSWFQKAFLRDICDPRATSVHARCNRGGSKTMLASLGVTGLSYFIPRYKQAILAGSEEQAGQAYSYFVTFMEGSSLSELLLDGPPLRKRTTIKGGGYVKILTASEKTVRSGRHDLLYFDETCQAEPDIIDAGLGCNVHSPQPKTLMTSTPDKIFHPFYEIDVDREGKGADFKFHHWTCYDCPWISAEEIERKKRLYDTNRFRIEMLGEYGSATGSVFDVDLLEQSFAKGANMYVPTQTNPWLASGMGIDWGWNHPTVCTIAKVDPIEYRIWITLARPFRFKTIDTIANEVKVDVATHAVKRVCCDAENPGYIRQLKNELRAFMIPVQAIPFNKYKDQMLTNFRKLLEDGRLIIDTRLRQTKEQLLAYHFMKDQDRPEKKEDDFVDSAILAVHSIIEQLGMEFLTSVDKEQLSSISHKIDNFESSPGGRAIEVYTYDDLWRY